MEKIDWDNVISFEFLPPLKQGDKVEFKWYGSDNMYVGRIEVKNNYNSLYFVEEHYYENDVLTPLGSSMRFYNPLATFHSFTYFKIIN